MKRFRQALLCLSLLLCGVAKGQIAPVPTTTPDSVVISLLTCSAGQEVWAQYGHTALRVHNKATGSDLAVNYGVFDASQPNFVLRFVFGLTDYSMGVIPMELFLKEYALEGRGVTEQVLNLTSKDKEAICKALQDNARPENVVYRYNFFYDNCTTRARDIVLQHLGGKVAYGPWQDHGKSFRNLIHRCNGNDPWARFGEDLLLGIGADRPITRAQAQFLPDNLRADFAQATYHGQPLVAQTTQLLPAVTQSNAPYSGIDPGWSIIIFAVLSFAISVIEDLKGKIYWGVDLVCMLLSGIPGIILTAMLFSQHPTVRVNLLLLIFNPLPLLMAWRATRRTIKHQKDYWWALWAILLVAGMIGGKFQSYPDSMVILALSLLFRPIAHLLSMYKNKQIATQQ